MNFYAVAALVALVGCAIAQDDVPPFLRRATPAQLQSFQTLIANNGHLTDAQLDANVQKWIAEQGNPIQADWNDFQAYIKQNAAQAQAQHDQAIANYSPAAKAADADLLKIASDASLGVKAKHEKINAYLAALPAAVRTELTGPQGR